MASLFESFGRKCEECGKEGRDSTQGYKVVEHRHLCLPCARDLASAILADVSNAAVKWPCLKHKNKEVEIFCFKCKVAVCNTCALTSHHGHQMQDIERFFAERKETVKKDVEEISAKQIETRDFMEKTERRSLEIEAHFKDIKNKISATFQTKSKDQEERKNEQIARINTEADDLNRRIEERRQFDLAKINEHYDKEHGALVKSRDDVLSDLNGIIDNVRRMTSDVKTSAEASNAELERAAAFAKSIMVDCDGKTFREKVAKFHEKGMEKLPSLDRDHLDTLSMVAKKVRFKRVDDEQRIGTLTGKKTSFEMVKTVNISSDIREPFLLGAIDDQTLVFRNGNGTALHTINVETGSMEILLAEEKTRGIWDLAVLPDKGFVYSDYNAGLLQICDKDGNHERSVVLPDDESRFALLAVDREGKVLATSPNIGEIHVVDPKAGSHLHTIADIGSKPVVGCETFANGDIALSSESSDICRVLRETGEVQMELSLADWSRRINFHVGPDDMIYVTYRTSADQEYTGFVSLISPDGVVRREKVIEFPTSSTYRHRPRCIVPVPGTVVILNGNVLLVYEQMPGITDLYV